jgi:hypothetical protein
MSAIPGDYPPNMTLDPREVKHLCKTAANVIKSRFATPISVCDQVYFTFPATPDFISQEFAMPIRPLSETNLLETPVRGTSETTQKAARKNTFAVLMQVMCDANGLITGPDLALLKDAIRKDCTLLQMINLGVKDDLCTLFHQAAAGSAHDAGLVDGMIQMGALARQPMLYCRKDPGPKKIPIPRSQLPNAMALHSAAIAGFTDIVRNILEADSMIDINTPTFHTKETLAHLAVKHGHPILFNLLEALGADIRIKDGKGNRVCDVTSDRTWAKEIAELIANYLDSDNTQHPKTATDSTKIPETVATQHNEQGEQHSRERGSVASVPRDSHKKKRNKKKSKKAKKDKHGGLGDAEKESIIAAAATPTVKNVGAASASLFLKRLLLSVGKELDQTVDADAVNELEEMLSAVVTDVFARLRDIDIDARNKLSDVQHACAFIDNLRGFSKSFSQTVRQYSERQVRVAIFSQAFQLVHMMQKLHRIDHAAMTVPALAPVRASCETNADFSNFLVEQLESDSRLEEMRRRKSSWSCRRNGF